MTGNMMGWFVDEDNNRCELPILELLHDVKTRWDSIYFMINRLRTLQQVSVHRSLSYHDFHAMQALDSFFQLPSHQDIS
jgi:hypothetical protein